GTELSVHELADQKTADHRVAEDRHALGVIFRGEGFHPTTFLRRPDTPGGARASLAEGPSARQPPWMVGAASPRGPSARSVVAVRSAACRNVKVSGHARPSATSVPAFASCAQRRSVLHVAPSAGSRALAIGAIASRTAGALSTW